MKVQLTLTSDQIDEVTLMSLKDAKKNLYHFGTKQLVFDDDKKLEEALQIVIKHYTP
jgi:hypothetical protein